MRRFIIGDLHGAYKPLMEVLEKVGFDKKEDRLYSTGDIADGYPEVYECLACLKSLKHFHPVIGNHDIWLQNWLSKGAAPMEWVCQGGRSTLLSFERNDVSPEERKELAEWMRSWPYCRILKDAIIMHGGPGYDMSLSRITELSKVKRPLYEPMDYFSEEEDRMTLLWDREYYYGAVKGALAKPFPSKKMLIVGHTEIDGFIPFISKENRLVNLDTGAGWNGRLTIMDMDTLEYWQAGRSQGYYPGFGPESIR